MDNLVTSCLFIVNYISKKFICSEVWYLISVILALKRMNQEDFFKFKISLG